MFWLSFNVLPLYVRSLGVLNISQISFYFTWNLSYYQRGKSSPDTWETATKTAATPVAPGISVTENMAVKLTNILTILENVA